MYCRHCGREIDNMADVCLGCGGAVHTAPAERHVSAAWWWLGFFIPLAGLLIWGLCSDSEPKKAKKAGVGAIVGLICSAVFSALYYVAMLILPFLPLFF